MNTKNRQIGIHSHSLQNTSIYSRNLDSFGVPLLESAYKRSEFYHRMIGLRETICQHLVLLYLLPHHQASSHWKTELKAWASELKRLRKGKKGSLNFDKKDLETSLFNDPFETKEERDSFIHDLRNNYPIPEEAHLEDHSFKEFVSHYLKLILGEKSDF